VNVKKHILSGIVASYVLGLATELNNRSLKLYVNISEIAKAKLEFELSLEALLTKNTIAPLITKRKETLSSNAPVKYLFKL